jgi:hypothetical protein
MKSDGPLILAVLFLATGLTLIFDYGVGTAAFNAAYPFSAANLQMSIATTGPAAIGGLALTALGVLTLCWALVCAFVGENVWSGGGRRNRKSWNALSEREWNSSSACSSRKTGCGQLSPDIEANFPGMGCRPAGNGGEAREIRVRPISRVRSLTAPGAQGYNTLSAFAAREELLYAPVFAK